MTTDPTKPLPDADTEPANTSIPNDPNAVPRDERVSQTASRSPEETRTLFEAGSKEEERLVDAVIEAEERPGGSNLNMPYDVDPARQQAAVKPED